MSLTASQRRTLQWIYDHGPARVHGDTLVSIAASSAISGNRVQPKKHSCIPLLHLIQGGYVAALEEINWTDQPLFFLITPKGTDAVLEERKDDAH